MKRRISLRLRRYLPASDFTSQVGQLKAWWGAFAGDQMLDWLEETGLVRPVLRLAWPEPIARRWWREDHEWAGDMQGAVEPDGPRLAAATELQRALSWADLRGIHSDASHPLDDPKAEWSQFLQLEEIQAFVPRADRRYSMGNSHESELYDRNHIKDFYAAWQVLAAAEIGGMGIFIRLDMSNASVAEAARAALRDGRRPRGQAFELFAPARTVRGLSRHRASLEASTWSAEEGEVAFLRAARDHRGSRIWLTREEAAQCHADRIIAARTAMARHRVDANAVLALCAFLAERWEKWDQEGRPLMAEAYRTHLASAVRMLRLAEELSFDEVAAQVGPQGDRGDSLLRRVWPDWTAAQRERVSLTLQSSSQAIGLRALTASELDAFTGFLAREHQDAFFLLAQSFADHAFDMNGPTPMSGMSSDLQGMAVAVEHAVRAMGGEGDQLYTMFRKLWVGTSVERHLRRNDQLARNAALMSDWPNFKARIAAVAEIDEAGAVAADLIMAHRLRGAVHVPLPEINQLELEGLLVQLMRAAAVTHAHVERRKRTPSAK